MEDDSRGVNVKVEVEIENKGQTALHMACKGQNLEVVKDLIKAQPSLVNMTDNKGNTPLHIATRKGRPQIIKLLLEQNEIDKKVINRFNETALDIAEKMSQYEIAGTLHEYGVQNANPARELKQTVSDIKHEVHDQLKTTRQTRKRIHGITKRLHKMHREGLNNAINSSTVVAVLIATVAFAGVFQIPGQYYMDPHNMPPGRVIGEANISHHPSFILFFIFNSLALFIALAVVVIQTTVVVIESNAKKKLMSIINKLIWVACVFLSVGYLALSFVVVGPRYSLMAILVTAVGAIIIASTIGVMLYWIIKHRIQSSTKRNNSHPNTSLQCSDSIHSDDNDEFKKIYAI